MSKVELPADWVHQAFRFEVDRPSSHPAIFSHEGAKRFAWNWALSLVEGQLEAKRVFRVLALRQGARTEEAEAFAERAAAIPALVEANDRRREAHEAAVEQGKRKGEYRPVSASLPWSFEALRLVWNREKREAAPWWEENSKECYSSAFEALSVALRNFFDSRSAERKGSRVGWPKYKRRAGRQSTSFTTGAIAVVDRHHVGLPVIGHLRVKESTDKLRLRVTAGKARILRATLATEGAKTYVSFSVAAERHVGAEPSGVAGHDVGISALVTSSDAGVAENPRASVRVKKSVSRYQRRMDRQHRAASPRCFDERGRHVAGVCHWGRQGRSKRYAETKRKSDRAQTKATNIRKDTIHKKSYHDSATYKVNVVEDLNTAGMGKKGRGKRGYNRALRDAALAEYRRQMHYKSTWNGSTLWLASRWYPSSKLCSACRTKKSHLPRSQRVFRCESCGLEIDRDLNAAKNLAALAELAALCLLAQMLTGKPVDWSLLPIRPDGWEQKDTRSSRGCARAGARGRPPDDDGGGVRPADSDNPSPSGVRPFDREATEPPTPLGARMSEVA